MSKRGFSLLELLVTIAILTLLAVIAIPNLLEAQVKARVARSANDMAELAKAIESYFIDHRIYPAVDHSLGSQGGFGANRGVTGASDPFLRLPTFGHRPDPGSELAQLTTPIAYIGAYPNDPFAEANSATFSYSTGNEFELGPDVRGEGWVMWSLGPGGNYSPTGSGAAGPVPLVNVGVAGDTRVDAEFYNPESYVPSDTLTGLLYDPTNGTRSPGVIVRYKQ